MKTTLSAIALALLGSTAMAADNGWYVGGDISRTKFEVSGDSVSKTGVGFFGGYRLNENVAFEGTFRRMGTFDCVADDCGAHSISASVIAGAKVADSFTLFGRVGFARNSLDVREGSTTYSEHKSKALIGLGGEFHINKHFGVRGEFVNLGKNKIDGYTFKITQFNLGMTYSF
ncbi:OOP family OmpA-OmpF porin [Inhella inkyongensis]|uniref:OOP family OmpA-OmpF porin n=1 Tax=Inhella inkyongensis TaxID=392593 RepID=A0A840S8Q1_9BURK|nr:porin family protein [Inhella inkyongensis]MBB5204789.1 OOP family OmpA-OmpF porin [Inhella inkyongensis]